MNQCSNNFNESFIAALYYSNLLHYFVLLWKEQRSEIILNFTLLKLIAKSSTKDLSTKSASKHFWHFAGVSFCIGDTLMQTFAI